MTYEKYIPAALVLILLAGCVAWQQPEDQDTIPDIANIGGYTAESKLAAGTSSPGVIIDWPAFIDSSKLQELVAEALANNHDLQATRARWLAAVAQSEASTGQRWPVLGTNVERSRQENEMMGNPVVSDSARASLSVSWEVDLWGGVALGAKSAVFNALRQEELLGWSRYSLAAMTTKTWLDNIEAQQQWTLAQARESNLKSNLEIIQDGFYSGIRDALDVYTARAEYASSQSNTLLREQAFLRLQRQLHALLGRYPEPGMDIPANSPNLAIPLLDGIPLTLLERRPDLRASANALIAQQANLGIAKVNRLPSLTLRGSYGSTGEGLSDALGGDEIFWNAIGGLSAPLFRGGALAAEQRRQKALLEAALADYRSIVLTAIGEVEQNLDNERLLQEQLAAASRANDVSRTAEDQAFESYVAGISNLNTWLLAQRTAFNRNGELIRLRTSLLKNRVDLYLALAGDFGAASVK